MAACLSFPVITIKGSGSRADGGGGRDVEERVTDRQACISIHVISFEGAET